MSCYCNSEVMGHKYPYTQNTDINLDFLLNEKRKENILPFKSFFVGLSDDGYFLFFIPECWDNVEFNTTELDVHCNNFDYGHLVISY